MGHDHIFNGNFFKHSVPYLVAANDNGSENENDEV